LNNDNVKAKLKPDSKYLFTLRCSTQTFYTTHLAMQIVPDRGVDRTSFVLRLIVLFSIFFFNLEKKVVGEFRASAGKFFENTMHAVVIFCIFIGLSALTP
jgi:phosphate starvation-inducible membrane PsiE